LRDCQDLPHTSLLGILTFQPHMKIITLLTDFGSIYPAQMKGAILMQTVNVLLVDISHDIPPQDIRSGAFALLSTAKYFPEGTIHLAVVDPTVGTERLGLVIESGGHIFVGPDNGLLIPAAKSLGTPKVHKIALQFDAAPTFHGRDIFAPVVAMLAQGCKPASIGPIIEPVDLDFGSPRRVECGIEASVTFIDSFGNVILNMRELPSVDLKLKGKKLRRIKTYAEACEIEPLITVGSHGFVEIAVNRGSAADLFGLAAADQITLEEMNCSE
jgi:S-adenosylmethionine hydrolase